MTELHLLKKNIQEAWGKQLALDAQQKVWCAVSWWKWRRCSIEALYTANQMTENGQSHNLQTYCQQYEAAFTQHTFLTRWFYQFQGWCSGKRALMNYVQAQHYYQALLNIALPNTNDEAGAKVHLATASKNETQKPRSATQRINRFFRLPHTTPDTAVQPKRLLSDWLEEGMPPKARQYFAEQLYRKKDWSWFQWLVDFFNSSIASMQKPITINHTVSANASNTKDNPTHLLIAQQPPKTLVVMTPSAQAVAISPYSFSVLTPSKLNDSNTLKAHWQAFQVELLAFDAHFKSLNSMGITSDAHAAKAKQFLNAMKKYKKLFHPDFQGTDIRATGQTTRQAAHDYFNLFMAELNARKAALSAWLDALSQNKQNTPYWTLWSQVRSEIDELTTLFELEKQKFLAELQVVSDGIARLAAGTTTSDLSSVGNHLNKAESRLDNVGNNLGKIEATLDHVAADQKMIEKSLTTIDIRLERIKKEQETLFRENAIVEQRLESVREEQAMIQQENAIFEQRLESVRKEQAMIQQENATFEQRNAIVERGIAQLQAQMQWMLSMMSNKPAQEPNAVNPPPQIVREESRPGSPSRLFAAIPDDSNRAEPVAEKSTDVQAQNTSAERVESHDDHNQEVSQVRSSNIPMPP